MILVIDGQGGGIGRSLVELFSICESTVLLSILNNVLCKRFIYSRNIL